MLLRGAVTTAVVMKYRKRSCWSSHCCGEGKYRKGSFGSRHRCGSGEIQRKLLRERALLRQWEKTVGGGGRGGEGDGEERLLWGFGGVF